MPSGDWLAVISEDQQKEIANRIEAAADMGDVIQIQSIANELKAANDEMAPFCDELVRLAKDFNFAGIQKFVLELDNYKDTAS